MNLSWFRWGLGYTEYTLPRDQGQGRDKVLCKTSCNSEARAVTRSWTAQRAPKSPTNQPRKSRGSSCLSSTAPGEQIAKRWQLCSPQEERKCQTSAGKQLSDTQPFPELSSGSGGGRWWGFPPAAHLMPPG